MGESPLRKRICDEVFRRIMMRYYPFTCTTASLKARGVHGAESMAGHPAVGCADKRGDIGFLGACQPCTPISTLALNGTRVSPDGSPEVDIDIHDSGISILRRFFVCLA